MSAETGQADGSTSAAQPAGPSGHSGVFGSVSALDRAANWHHELVALVDGWSWIRTLNDQLTAVLAPWRERYQDNPVLELMHGGRWLGHPLHPALSDLPIGFWAGSALLDLTGGDPVPEGGLDPAGLFTAAGIVAAVATAATGVQADGRQILLYRHDGTLYALDNLCSHAAGLLSRGAVEGLTVTCPLHGSQYCLADGSVRRGPSHQPQPVIRTRVRNGWIEVRGNQPAPRRAANGRK